MLDWCTQWPTAPADNPAGPPVPPSGHYSDVPVLVLSGELDSITTPAEGDLVSAQFPNARHVVVSNSFHVTAIGDTDDCAVRIMRSFVAAPTAATRPALLRCAGKVAPVRAMGRFPAPLPAAPSAAAVARTAALTVADLQDRWWNSYSGHGVGLRGGTWRYTGDEVVRFRLDRVRLVGGLAVSGTATWDRYAETMDVHARRHRPRGRPAVGLVGHPHRRSPRRTQRSPGRSSASGRLSPLPGPSAGCGGFEARRWRSSHLSHRRWLRCERSEPRNHRKGGWDAPQRGMCSRHSRWPKASSPSQASVSMTTS